jgi:site-specific DNA recombinase
MKSALRQAAAPRAVLYLRQSTYREESISLELQESAGRAHAEKRGYVVVDVLSDPGISGRTWKRPAVQRVMDMLEQGEAEVVILWRWSRLSRSRKDWALAADRADVAGGRIESATEPNDVTAAGRFARGVMTELAAFESERIGEQWKETHERRRNLGLPAEGGPRYGYEKQADGNYKLDTEKGPVVADMYRRYLAGEGFTSIARGLNRAGIRTGAGMDWSRQSVKQVLDAGFGAGRIIHRPGRKSLRPADATYYDGAHESVISDDEWARYVAMRSEAPQGSTVIEPKYMLAGLIFCECGAPMHVGNRGLIDYKCSAKAQGRSEKGQTITRVRVEEAVRLWIQEFASDLDALAEAEAKGLDTKIRAVNSQSAVDARIKRIDGRMAKLTVKWLDDDLDEAAYRATVAQLTAERKSLGERTTVNDKAARREVDVRRLAIELSSYWDSMTPRERRNVLREIIDRVVIVPPVRPGTGVWRERVQITAAWESAVSE